MGSAYTTVAATTAVDATWPFDVAGGAGQTAVALLATYRIASPPPPTITGQPTDQTVNNGATATFSVTATGTAPITYQWQDNSSGSFADISGATSSSYSPTASYSIQDGSIGALSPMRTAPRPAAATLRVAFSLSGTGPRSVSLLGHPFGRGVRGVGAWHGVGWRRCWWRWMRQSPARRPSYRRSPPRSGCPALQTSSRQSRQLRPASGCRLRSPTGHRCRCAEHADPAGRDAGPGR